jgi:hypothetical protein
VARRVARLRAQHEARLRLPDAMVLATAIHLHADRVLTTDARWPTTEIAVEVIGNHPMDEGSREKQGGPAWRGPSCQP